MKNETTHIVNAMRRASPNAPIIQQWKAAVEQWAMREKAVDVLAWLPCWRVRPFYTADELAPIWPALAIATAYTVHWPNVLKSARRLEFELDFARLPRLVSHQNFFIVERFKYWTDPRRTLEEIENALR